MTVREGRIIAVARATGSRYGTAMRLTKSE
jgi:hypothetical protein